MRTVEIPAVGVLMTVLSLSGMPVTAADLSQSFVLVSTSDHWAASLEPKYIKTAPRTDAWGTPFRYVVTANRQSYRIVSAGTDRTFEAGSLTLDKLSQHATAVVGADIIYQNGQFVQYPGSADPYVKKTMADMRSLGTAVEAFAIDEFKYPDAEPRKSVAASPQSVPSTGDVDSRTPRKHYTGEPVSLNLKDADLRDVTSAFSKLTGLKIETDAGINAKVTIAVHDTPWDEALDRIIGDAGLQWELHDKMLHISARPTTALSQPAPPAGSAAATGWRTWTAPNGRFSIDLPDEPITSVTEKPTGWYSINTANRVVSAYLEDFSGDVATEVTSEEWVRRTVPSLPQGQLVDTRMSTLGGLAARYATIDFVANDVNFRMRFVRFSPKVHMIAIVGYSAPKSQVESRSDAINRLFSSMRVPPAPTQIAAAPVAAAQPVPAGASVGWRTWTAPDGRFSIELPGEPIDRVIEMGAGYYEILIGTRMVTAHISGELSGDVSASLVTDESVRSIVSSMASNHGQLVETHLSTTGGLVVRYATIDFVKDDVTYRMQAVFSSPSAHTLATALYTAPRSQVESRQVESARVLSSLRILPAAALAGISANQAPNGSQQKDAILHTSAGDISVRFFPDVAPNHVRNFVELANRGFYDGVKFHRIIPGFMIQTGDPNTISGPISSWGTGGSGKTLKGEFNSIPHTRGIVSMARSQNPDSASSQFFIVVKDSSSLDGKYTVFGHVTTGMEIADKIANAPRGQNDRPNDPVTIKSITFRELMPEKQVH